MRLTAHDTAAAILAVEPTPTPDGYRWLHITGIIEGTIDGDLSDAVTSNSRYDSSEAALPSVWTAAEDSVWNQVRLDDPADI